MDINVLPIDSIGLSARSSNALRRAGIHFVGDLLSYNQDSLSALPNLGAKSVAEISDKISEYGQKASSINAVPPCDADPCSDQEFVQAWLDSQNATISVLEHLSTQAYNLLLVNGYTALSRVVFLTVEDLMSIPRTDIVSAREIKESCENFLTQYASTIDAAYQSQLPPRSASNSSFITERILMPENKDRVLQYVRANDKKLSSYSLSSYTKRDLVLNSLQRLSDVFLLNRSALLDVYLMKTKSVDQITDLIQTYIIEHEEQLTRFLDGDDTVLYSDDQIRKAILDLYKDIGFGGLSFSDFQEHLKEKDIVLQESRLKRIIGGLLAEKQLEYIDFRCYKIYPEFEECMAADGSIDDRNRKITLERLSGRTLEEVARDYDVTRERIRQIVVKVMESVRKKYVRMSGMRFFSEDYYRYFYSTYAFDAKDGEEWLGITPHIRKYMQAFNIKSGKKDLSLALEDTENLDVSLRLKIKSYLNRNKVFIDGKWVNKTRAELESVVLAKCCSENTPYQAFPTIYNRFLEQVDVPYDERIYYKEAVYESRKNHLKDSRSLLWKYGEILRYYDIDGRDYAELIDTLNLADYENIELSTLKFTEMYPDIMARYDIRDQYELHNLLRKIIPDGSFHNFHCSRTPNISFGNFDREKALFELMSEHSPISAVELAEIIHEEYGYDQAVILSTYLSPFNKYYLHGTYDVTQKKMPAEHLELLHAALPEDFYYLSEVRQAYCELVPGADLELINAYNLKSMGFIVLSNYVVQHYPSLEAYCEDILTREDIVDLVPLKKRLVTVQLFYQKLSELKRSLDVIEFEPNQIMNFRKLKAAGIGKEMLHDFCDSVYDFVPTDTYFSIKSIRDSGFSSDLDDFGFSDLFHASVLLSDDRFSYSIMFGTPVFFKGNQNISIRTFEESLVAEAGSIDAFDLVSILTEKYGCRPEDKFSVIYKLNESGVFYDKILDRLYVNVDAYYRELDNMGGF